MLLHTLVEVLSATECEQRRVQGTTPGINATTRLLEANIDAARRGERIAHTPRFLFACLGDVEASALLAHIPMLVASYNAACAPASTPASTPASVPPLVLVPLASGAELILSTALQVRRAAVLLVDASLPGIAQVEQRIRTTLGAEAFAQGFRAPWLDQSVGAQPLALKPPHIKHLATGTPVNLAAAKAAKKASRKAHKAQRRIQQQRAVHANR